MKYWFQARSLCDRRGILAVLSGILIALSFPNAGLSVFAWFALIPMLVALENTTPKTAFRVGFTCGLSAYLGILYWINVVITRYGHLPWAASIPLYLLLVAWLALFYGGAAYLTRVCEQSGFKTALTLPLAWVACDLTRSFLLTGFPWAMLGHSQYRILTVIQIADIFGVYGVTLLIVLSNVVFYRVVRAGSCEQVTYPAKSALILIVALLVTLLYGFTKLNDAVPDQNQGSRPLSIVLIQGNIPQDVKWSPNFRDRTITTYERLSTTAAGKRVDLVVWPESAAPFFFQDQPVEAERLRSLARELRTFLLFGSPAHELRNGEIVFLNSAFILSPTGDTVARGDKLHLVPFGEYVPLGRFFPFISKLVVGIGDFSPGENAIPLDAGQTKAGLLVCYEAIFPELARAYVRNGARILVNITNDAWFGSTSAPHQHLSIAVFRAVETRTPLLRAANTGISAIIDQNGHIRAMTGLFEEAFERGEIHPGSGDSLYVKLGDSPAWLCLILTTAITLYSLYKSRKTRDGNPAGSRPDFQKP